mmetsp:Transcript_23441/g.61387  ORF Transcript_23441/g.61387 Transcript_23441/m.61387 type:complete len:411 (+) Transcript_23441:258-1490(+)
MAAGVSAGSIARAATPSGAPSLVSYRSPVAGSVRRCVCRSCATSRSTLRKKTRLGASLASSSAVACAAVRGYPVSTHPSVWQSSCASRLSTSSDSSESGSAPPLVRCFSIVLDAGTSAETACCRMSCVCTATKPYFLASIAATSWSAEPRAPRTTARGIHGAAVCFRVVSAGHTASTIAEGSRAAGTVTTNFPYDARSATTAASKRLWSAARSSAAGDGTGSQRSASASGGGLSTEWYTRLLSGCSNRPVSFCAADSTVAPSISSTCDGSTPATCSPIACFRSAGKFHRMNPFRTQSPSATRSITSCSRKSPGMSLPVSTYGLMDLPRSDSSSTAAVTISPISSKVAPVRVASMSHSSRRPDPIGPSTTTRGTGFRRRKEIMCANGSAGRLTTKSFVMVSISSNTRARSA